MNHPRQLGKYQIVEVLGEGAMGVVYKGFDPDIRRVVALKTIRSMHDDPEGAQMLAMRFRNEAQAVGRLNHPGIVNVFDYGSDQGVSYIAMEFVEGQTLAHYLSHKVRFTDEDVAGLMSQLLDALHHAHEAGVWHRDIKPANIMLAKNARLKVADFGIARIEASHLTQVTTMLGTPAYMAPEQFKGDIIDRRVDIYAAGVMLYVLLANRPPFTGTPEQLMYKVLQEHPVMPSALDNVNRPRFYDGVLARAMAKDPDQRYATAAEFKAAIEQGVGEPVDPSIWEQTIIGVPTVRVAPPDGSRAGRTSAPGNTTGTPPNRTSGMTAPWTQAPTNWDRSQLATAEQTLARFVGPLASVMVRRAARECADLPSLYAKLAAEVTDPGAKAAFATHLQEVTAQRTTSGGTSYSTSLGTPGGTGVASQRAALSDALLEQARKLLMPELGPIAGVLVKKTAAQSATREAFIDTLAAAVPDAEARQQIRDALLKL
jgi:eukaryotic-like serine/threonine-protein kinase